MVHAKMTAPVNSQTATAAFVGGKRSPDPCAMVIFGASGDLTERKIIPALYYLSRERILPEAFSVIGCGRTPFTHDQFREKQRQAVGEFLHLAPEEQARFPQQFGKGLFYLQGNFGEPAAYEKLRDLLEQVDRERGTAGNRLFYLATPPSFFPAIVKALGDAGLARPKDPDRTWARIIIEKPFGRDLASALALNRAVTGVFREDQVYRIDHYLGKETVQNLLVFRFANGVFEPIWNRRYIDHIQIAVAEDLGVEDRGSYYEEAGLMRDMIQNHVLQLMSLVAMEPPPAFQADAVRDEKAKVLRAVRPVPPGRLREFAVRGQYKEGVAKGQAVQAYRSEPKVAASSTTETFAALKLFIDDWRWADVPFYLRSGKRLAKRASEIAIQFRRVPHLLFRDCATQHISPNLLTIHLQPDEGMSLSFSAKLPGPVMRIQPVTMNFRYGDAFGASPPTAYETLLLDCMLGDATPLQSPGRRRAFLAARRSNPGRVESQRAERIDILRGGKLGARRGRRVHCRRRPRLGPAPRRVTDRWRSRRFMFTPTWRGLSRAAAEAFVQTANQCITGNGRFSAALSGGSTPRRMFELLGAPPFVNRADWSKVQLFQVDERCVPPDHPASNYRMIHGAWLGPGRLPDEILHRIEGEVENPGDAARRYAQDLESILPGREGNVSRFDLIFLGMGADGHTASLFPGSELMSEKSTWVAVSGAGPEGLRRITLTLPVLNAAARVVFLVSGADKADTLARAIDERRESGLFPVQLVAPSRGSVYWFVDREAASGLRAPGR